MIKKIVLCIFSVLSISFGYSQINWKGAINSDWNNPANWQPAIVPDSLSDVIIERDSASPQINWPAFGSDVYIQTLYTLNAELNLNGFNLKTTGVRFYSSKISSPLPVVTQILLQRILITTQSLFYDCEVTGNFNFYVQKDPNGTNVGFQLSKNIFLGDVILNFEGNTTVLSDNSEFKGNLSALHIGNGTSTFRMETFIIDGDFSFINRSGGGFIFRSFPYANTSNFQCRVGGKIDIDMVYTTNEILIITLVTNYTPGGKIKVEGARGAQFIKDSLLLDSLIIKDHLGTITMDSNFIDAHVFMDRVNGLGGGSVISLARNTFKKAVEIINALGEIRETRGTGIPTNIVHGAPNIYNGDAIFRGKLLLGVIDTSVFYKSLTIDTLAGSVLYSARFAGDSNGILNVGQLPITLQNLFLEKFGTGRLILESPLHIGNKARMTSGNLRVSPDNYLQFNHNTILEGGGLGSHVIGKVKKQGNSIFTFPIGSATSFNPVTISAPADTADIFSAEYFLASPATIGDTSLRAPTLKRITNCEYWDVKRENGTSNVNLTFSFDYPCASNPPAYITDPTKIHITRWTGSIWEDLGNGGSTGTTSGTISTAGAVNNFSPFTFASTDTLVNPLPVKLLGFWAIKDKNKARLTWQTTDEINLSGFDIERSADGLRYSSVAYVDARNNMGQYHYEHYDPLPIKGNNYYRLKLRDIDGQYKYSNVARLNFGNIGGINIFPNPASETISVEGLTGYKQLYITDMSGRKLLDRLIKDDAENINISLLPAGIYIVQMSNDTNMIFSRLVKK